MANLFSLEGKVVLVTGASRGIGKSVAQQLVAQGAKVAGTATSEGGAEKISAYLGDKGKGYKLNVTDADSITETLAAIKADMGDVDVLVNNAGITRDNLLMRMKDDEWQDIIDTNLSSIFRLSKAVLRPMMKKKSGRIINIGSIHGLVASPFKSAYVAAKHGLLGFSKVLALETSDVDITVNTICPAYVKTPLVEKQIADQATQHGISEEEVINKIMLEPMPKKSFIDIEEIAATVAFLASPEARNMTGQALVLDGGWTVK